MKGVVAVLIFGTCLNAGICSGQTVWRDSSPHRVQMITVDKDTQLEMLDWGGSGRPLVFLSGLGNTAHVFDDFAPKFTATHHVYAITRRGFGASSAPPTGYTADRLGDDVVSVLDMLKLESPVLAAHSLGGSELSSIAARHVGRVAGLIYLDAGYSYALYDSDHRDFTLDLVDLRGKLERLQNTPAERKQLVDVLLSETLPAFERVLRERQNAPSAPPVPIPAAPRASETDRSSFASWIAWQKKSQGYAVPEAEARQLFAVTPSGGVGERRGQPSIGAAIQNGMQKRADIGVPSLVIFALPHSPGAFMKESPAALAFLEAVDLESTGRQATFWETHVPSARVVRIPRADHFVFLTNEEEVTREMRAFLAGLSR
jgi:pimeloyl-ACP methyl ester carboxylesterase